jgi:hypothetical protein
MNSGFSERIGPLVWRPAALTLVALILVASGCSSDTVGDGHTASITDYLVGCESDVDADVPAFYSTYLRRTDISIDGGEVVVVSSGLPQHLSYYYGDNTDYPFGTAGVALDGVALCNPLAAPGDDIENEKFTFDSNEGHPQQQGAYHYHSVAVGPLRVLQSLGLSNSDIPGVAQVELYGVMCDGTVVMGGNELDGSSATALDLQAGHVHNIVNAGGFVLLEGRYHVHMAPSIGADPRGLTPEAQYCTTCDVGQN